MGKPVHKVNKHIINLVEKCAKQGLTMHQAWAIAEKKGYQDLPKSAPTFYKHYRVYHEAALSEIVGKVGNKVIDQAMEGDFNSQQLFLRSKGGWNPKETVETRQVGTEEEENTSALQSLMGMLKIEDSEEGEE